MQSKLKMGYGYLVLVISIFTWVSACTTARTNQFDKFAQAGIKFTDSLPPVLDESFKFTVETDSLILLESRENLKTKVERLDAIEASNKNLSQRVMLLNDLKRHAKLLRSYFLALKAMAQTEEASGISDVTEGLVDSLKKLDERITSISLGGLEIKDFVGKATQLSVATFQSAALNRELKLHAETIGREIDIQQAVLTVLRDAMEGDLETRMEAANRDKIILPFVGAGTLPKNWNTLRLEVFQQQIEISSLDAAVSASQGLKLSFIALAENRLEDDSIAILMQDIDSIMTFAGEISGNK